MVDREPDATNTAPSLSGSNKESRYSVTYVEFFLQKLFSSRKTTVPSGMDLYGDLPAASTSTSAGSSWNATAIEASTANAVPGDKAAVGETVVASDKVGIACSN